MWLIIGLFLASAVVVKIATFAKPESFINKCRKTEITITLILPTILNPFSNCLLSFSVIFVLN
ncbi:MAG TPA: hypothetical protein DCQ31_08670 [Bacteroidales bacterium]|nr:hypothetical protein [Bacteroidales bacterium]